ncbi:adenosylmethionine--8-amino-7-oxononanoate transaminase [Priestia aryabhattai]|uniref:adenosylmethionine--8-amino-7-oxononanoate transaminase n=1 Tax=Priestia aryabhattai TaxID=412384 RepID=UPI001C8E287C|nr:adenosylmethionine--8-amino-7-oxononanoate transaminase [Priestia aryabhattai]MBY0005989.1 adenosylmethionine--8-amino-7-oxononanoate transaminase [Priestia aryabhattai]MBY0048016.1 adenosylmethionine--8-amino-7-oxononanoate transaminase [Priestia aryabhattai]MDE8675650.1 adenosylmethionine--8-amino-7-oxononanoate transaminase [Priestia aryabhattai]MED4391461.1 adenosylmethionine--8-amino-7-oxononanoate transaminase [Priestia aryabhattai]
MSYQKAELEKWDKEYVWHPFTQMKAYRESNPLIIERGEGSYLYDVAGNKYLDGYASLWVNVHGHNDPELNTALHIQVEKLAHSTLLGSANVPSILLAKKLAEITPGSLSKVFYSDTGSAAVEIALKIAYQYWQNLDSAKYKNKSKFISLNEAYHGDTIGAVSVGGMDLFHRIFKPLLFERIPTPSPYIYRMDGFETEEQASAYCIHQLEKLLQNNGEEVAGLIIEPLVQGAAGIITHPPGFLKQVERLCKAYGVLLICDEVAVGFGRTGTLFACEQEDVVPDIMCVGKGITGGYMPLAATLTSEQIFNAFLAHPDENKTFFHGHTYTGNQLACTVALRNIELMEERELIRSVKERSKVFKRYLLKLYELPNVGDIRQRGLMAGIEVVKDRQTKSIFEDKKVMGDIILAARQKGLIIRELGPVITMMPILSMTDEELKTMVEIVYESIKEVIARYTVS